MNIKRTLACGAAVALLALPAIALAAIKTYRGDINGDPATALNLRVKKEGESRYFKRFRVRELALKCEGLTGRARLDSARLRGREPLDNRGRFTAKATSERGKLKVEGRARKRRATGTLRFSGSLRVEGAVRDCRSGEVRWTASR